MNNNHIKLLYSTDVEEELGTEEEILEYYKENLEANGLPVPKEPHIDDADVQDFISEQIHERYLDLLTNLAFTRAWDNIIAEGDFGRWDGRSQGVYVGTVEKALQSLLADCDNFKIEFDEDRGCILVTGYHHDNTNYGTIRSLSDRGKKFYENSRHDYSRTMREVAESILRGKMYRKVKEVFA